MEGGWESLPGVCPSPPKSTCHEENQGQRKQNEVENERRLDQAIAVAAGKTKVWPDMLHYAAAPIHMAST